jgi:hypothetical protein
LRHELDKRQSMAMRFYKAYGALCHSNLDDVSSLDEERLRAMREVLFMYYKLYDADNSFDVSLDYKYKSKSSNEPS